VVTEKREAQTDIAKVTAKDNLVVTRHVVTLNDQEIVVLKEALEKQGDKAGETE
jgi:hypothetical protein